MGLFDMFSGGGGSVSVRADSQQVSANGPLAGAVAFQGGTKAQQITNIKVKLVMEQVGMEMALVNGQQVQRQTTHSRDVIPFFEVTGAFQSTPGQVAQFPFNVQLPMGLMNSMPGQVKYRLVATADIDNAIDPGSNVEIQIVGGTPAAQGMMPGQGMMQGQGMMPPMPMPMAPPMAPAPLQIGSQVMGQWQDGSWYPGVIVAMQNGMIGVDWANPQLGQHSWLQPQQVQPQPMMQQQQQPMMMQQQAQPMMAPAGKFGPQAVQQVAQPQAQKGHDPYAKGAPDPYAKGSPAGKGGAAPGGVQIGAPVHAQHPSGQWYPGRVVALQNGLIGVDWDEPKLGESIWLQPQQVVAK
jgi:hypothetical protein